MLLNVVQSLLPKYPLTADVALARSTVTAVAVPPIVIGLPAVAAAVTLDTKPAASGVPLVHAPPVT